MTYLKIRLQLRQILKKLKRLIYLIWIMMTMMLLMNQNNQLLLGFYDLNKYNNKIILNYVSDVLMADKIWLILVAMYLHLVWSFSPLNKANKIIVFSALRYHQNKNFIFIKSFTHSLNRMYNYRPLLATQISLESIQSDHTEVNSEHASEEIPEAEISAALEVNDPGIKSNHFNINCFNIMLFTHFLMEKNIISFYCLLVILK